MYGGDVTDLMGSLAGGMKRKRSKNCHCGLPGCICRCAKDKCRIGCRCMKCNSKKSRRRRSTRRMVKRGGCIGSDPSMCGGRRRGRPCKSLKRKKKRRPNKTRKMRR